MFVLDVILLESHERGHARCNRHFTLRRRRFLLKLSLRWKREIYGPDNKIYGIPRDSNLRRLLQS